MSINIIYILSNKDKYNKYISFIKEHTVSKETFTVLQDLSDYFAQHPTHDSVDWSVFATWWRVVKHPMFKEDKQALYQEMFDTLSSTTSLDGDTEESLLQAFIERDYATQAADIALKVAEGETRGDLGRLQDILDSYHRETGKMAQMDSHEVRETLADIIVKVRASGLSWRLDCLNRSVGPLRKGDFIIFAARPDSGKTTWLASEASYMAPQLEEDECVLWFNNEEQGWKVRYRVIQAAIGWDSMAIEANETAAWDEYCKVVGEHKIRIVDKADLSIRDVNHYLTKYKPGLIIFDQLWKIHGFEKKAVNEVANQTLLANQAREWAKEYAPVLNVHQADGSAEGVKYITQNQLYGSKTGIQGEADAIITLGRSHEPGLEMSRFVYVPKNKMIGGPHTVSSEKNGKYEIVIQPQIARFKE